MNVLIVDNLPSNILTLEQRLVSMGVKDVVHARYPAQALRLLSEPGREFDLIIANLLMPPTEGIGLMRELANRDQPNPVPLAVAGQLEPSMEHAIQSLAGALGYPLAGFIGNPLHDTGLAHIFGNILARQGRPSKMHLVPRAQEYDAESLAQGIKHGQLQVVFQPVLASRGLTLEGVVALPRWHHPELGLIDLPPLEQTGRIPCLGDEVFRQTIGALRQFTGHGIETCADINLPLAGLNQDLIASFKQLAARHNIPHRRIRFAITERAGLLQQPSVVGMLAELRLQGFGLSLDRFGCGESSLTSLGTVPVSLIKIDPSYTADINTNSMQRKLLKSMLDIGRQIGVKVVATGIENDQQRRYLAGIGCQLLQGDFIAKPMPAEQIIRRYGSVATGISRAS